MIGWGHIGIEGRDVWAYVADEHFEAHEPPQGIPARATIGGVEMLIQVTRISARGFDADILGRAPVAESISEPTQDRPADGGIIPAGYYNGLVGEPVRLPAPERGLAPAENQEESHGE